MLTPAPVVDTIYTMKKSIVMMAVLLAAIIGSMFLIGCPDETGGGGTGTGTDWTAQTSNVSGQLFDIHYAGGLWVAAGQDFITDNMGTITSVTGAITTSTNGTKWTAQTSNVSGQLFDVHYAGGLWVAAGQNFTIDNMGTITSVTGAITTSTNGTDWTAQDSKITGGVNAIHYATDADGNNGLWVAVGFNRTTDGMGNTTETRAISTSTNGTAWTAQTSNMSGELRAVHYANNLWVAVGNNPTTDSMGTTTTSGIITTSTNGTNWTAQTSNVSGGLGTIHYANSRWVAVGFNSTTDSMGTTTTSGAITTSTNGTNWTAQTSNVSGGLGAIHYANSRWVAVGFNSTTDSMGNLTFTGAITTSTNSTDWTAQTSNVSDVLGAIHYANGRWVAVGVGATGGAITTSTNGTDWTAQTSNVSGTLRDIHYANGRWVAVGLNGAITTAPCRAERSHNDGTITGARGGRDDPPAL